MREGYLQPRRTRCIRPTGSRYDEITDSKPDCSGIDDRSRAARIRSVCKREGDPPMCRSGSENRADLPRPDRLQYDGAREHLQIMHAEAWPAALNPNIADPRRT